MRGIITRTMGALLIVLALYGGASPTFAAPVPPVSAPTVAVPTAIPPTDTPVPTAVPPTATEPPPHAGTVSVTPNDLTLSAADVAGSGPSITVLGRDLPPNISIVVALSGPNGSGGTERELTPSVGQPTTDARGQMEWSGDLGPGSTLKAGAYTIKLRVYKSTLLGLWNQTGALLAQTALLIKNPPPASCPPGQIGVPWGCQDTGGWWTGLTQGALMDINQFTEDGRDDLLTALWKLCMHSVDLTQPPFGPLVDRTGPWVTWGLVAFGFLFTLRLFYEMILYLKSRQHLYRLGAVWIEAWLVVQVARTYIGLMHKIWGFATVYTDSLAGIGLKPLEDALSHFTTVNPHDLLTLLYWVAGNVIALAIKAFIIYLLAMIVLTKLSLLGVLVGAFIAGPFIVVFYALPQTRRVAQSWTAVILAVSSLPIGYAFALTLAGQTALLLASHAGSWWATPLIAVATGAAVIMAVNAMPSACVWLWTHITGGSASFVGQARYHFEDYLRDRAPKGFDAGVDAFGKA